jgi:pyruvate dehydrogenase E1 component
MQDGLRRMYTTSPEHPLGEDVIFYVTVYNEPVSQPKEPADLDLEGLLKGIYRFGSGPDLGGAPKVQLMASGVGFPWILEAQKMLAEEWGVSADLWSVTSWNELARDAIATERDALLHPDQSPRLPFVTSRLDGAPGPFIAVSDYMRAVPLQIARWVPGDFHTLGTDGFGFADTRAAARRFFNVDAQSVVVQALQALAVRGQVKPETVTEAFNRYRIDDPTAVSGVLQEGGDA